MNPRLWAMLVGGSMLLPAIEHTAWARGFGGLGSYATATGAPPYAYGNYGGGLNATRFAYASPAQANPRMGSFLGVPDESAVDPAGLRMELLDRYDRPGRDPARGMGGFLEGYGVPIKPDVEETGRPTDTVSEPDEGDMRGLGSGELRGLPSDGGLHLAGNAGTGSKSGGRRDLTLLSDIDARLHAALVRRNWRPGDLFSSEWYRNCPSAWRPTAWTAGDAWTSAAWTSLATWFDSSLGQPWNFDYGRNIVYRDNAVYVNATKVASGDEYYQQAQMLAAAGAADPAVSGESWLPLGVFALTHQAQSKPTIILQLAIDKAGLVRGNYTNVVAGNTLPLHGSLDKKTQRVALVVGDNAHNVIETGIYNLTKDQLPALLHYGKDRTEQWLLVRLKKDSDDSPSSR